MNLEKMNSLNDKRNDTSTEGMCVDKLDSERSGNLQFGDRISQHRFPKLTSYRDAFVISDLRWESSFQ